MHWNPQGKRNGGRPKNTWRRELNDEVKMIGKTWRELHAIAKDRTAWRELVEGLCSIGG